MKKLRLLLLTISMLMCSVSIFAQGFEVGGICYTIVNENSKMVGVINPQQMGRSPYSGVISIPQIVRYGGVSYTVTDILEYAFNGIGNLTEVNIPSSIIRISKGAFLHARQLTSINVSDYNEKYSSKDGVLFSKDRTKLLQYPPGNKQSTYELPNEVANIEDIAFMTSTWLTAINVGLNNENYSSQEGVLFSKDKKVLIRYPFRKAGSFYEIPDMVTQIAPYAFYDCFMLSEISISNNVSSIGVAAFYSCENLTKVNMGKGNNALTIGDRSFYDCVNLTGINLGNRVTNIGMEAFHGCPITEIIIPNSVKSIGCYAFTSLKKITCFAQYPPIGSSCMWESWIDSDNCILKVPQASIDAYRSAEGWKRLKNIEGLEKYAVIYKIDDEVYAVDSVEYGSRIEVMQDPVRNGYRFNGWSNVPEVMPAEDLTITGSFTAIRYMVTYELDGEILRTDSVTYGTKLVLPEVAEKEGFSFSGWQNVPETMPANDVTISAGFTANKYLVTFILDGEVFKTDSVTYGTKLVLPEVEEKEGHTFSGWQNVPETMPAIDVRIEASFTANKYLVTFMLDGEIFKTDSVTYGTEITLPEVEEKEGHTFSGWQNVPETMPSSDVRIEATFIANKYLVTFMLDGEIFKTDSVTYGTEIVLPEVAEKEGYTFSGWQNVPQTMPASDVRIEASFSANKYLVTFMLDGEIFNTDSVTYGTEIALPEVEEREGHTFSGWQNVPETMPASDVRIEASFTANKYLVTFILDGEIFKTDSVTYGTEITLPEVEEKEGHTFSGWQNVPETMPASDVRIEANFTPNKYLVIFVLDGEIFKTDSVTYGTEITIPEVEEKEGHTFSGWQDVPQTMPASDVRIEANFTANKYLVTFMLDGEIFKTDSVTYGTEITLPEVEEKEGHTFSGWQNAPEIMPAKDVRIEANFTANKYLVTFMLDGEIFKTDSVTYGTEITIPEIEEKEGYTFSGWQNVPETMPANDMIIEGTFTVNIYAIIYKVDGEIYAVDSVAYGETIVLREEPVREGYKFSGWSQVSETMPAADVEVTGSFTVGINAIDFDAKVDVYNLQGVILYHQVRLEESTNNLPEGVYLIRQGRRIIKIKID